MNMDTVITAKYCPQRRKSRSHDGSNTGDIHHRYTADMNTVIHFRCKVRILTPAVEGNIMAKLSHTNSQCLHCHLNSATMGGNLLMSKHCDFQ